jgi:SPP1 gp7 family putative phage head morphogenesis protein
MTKRKTYEQIKGDAELRGKIFDGWAEGKDVSALATQHNVRVDAVEQVARGEVRQHQMGPGIMSVADPNHLYGAYSTTAYNPSKLVSRKGLKIFDEMRKDDQIKAATLFKKHTVLSTGYDLQAPEGHPELGMDWEPAEFVHAQLEGLAGSFQKTAMDILTAMDYGYSVSEKVFEPITEGEWAGKLGLSRIMTRRPHPFRFKPDDKGVLPEDGLYQEGHETKPLPIGKFVVWSYMKEFDNWYGTSDLEAAYRAWWSKDNAYRWANMLLERFGIPPVIGMYDPKKYNASQINELQAAMESMQDATSMMLPRSGGQEVLDFFTPELAGQGARVFQPLLEMFNKDISRAILMPGLLGLSPEDQVGSMARAKVQFDVFLLVIEFVRTEFEQRIMQDQVIKQLVDLNYDTKGLYPQFRFLPLTDDIREDILALWFQAVTTGVVVSTLRDEEHIRETLKFPAREEGEEGLEPDDEENDDDDPDDDPVPDDKPGGNKPVAPKPSGKPADDKDGSGGGSKDPKNNAHDDSDGNHVMGGSSGEATHSSLLWTTTEGEHYHTVASHAATGDETSLPETWLGTVTGGHRHEVEVDDAGTIHLAPAGDDEAHMHTHTVETPRYGAFNLQRAKKDYELKVDFKAIANDFDQLDNAMSPILRDRLLAVEQHLLNHIERKYDGKAEFATTGIKDRLRGMDAFEDAVGQMLDLAYNQGKRSLKREVPAAFADSPNFVPKDATEYLKAKRLWITGVVRKDIIEAVRGDMLAAIEAGDSTQQAMARVRETFTPYVGSDVPGEVASGARTETIVRTNTTDAYNRGRLIQSRRAGPLLQGFRYSAILDTRTTQVCTFLDGKLFRPEDPALNQLKPPRHYNCRSVVVPVVGEQVSRADFIKPTQVARGLELSHAKFK